MNTTVTNYAEKKAKQFLNLLQGYTKGIRLTAILILLLMGVSNAWAKTIYFAPSSNWKDANAWFQVWDGSKNNNFSKTGIEGLYKADITETATKVWIKRMNPNGGEWDDGAETTLATYNYFYNSGWSSTMSRKNIIGTVTGGHIYFDNSTTNWTGNIQFVIGHKDYSRTYEMTQLENTQLWYVNLTDKANHTWGDATYYGFIASSNKFGDGDWGPSNLKNATQYTAEYTSSYSLDNGSSYYCKPSSATNGKSFTITYVNGYNAISKYNATQAAKLRNDITSSYATVNGTWPTTLKLKGTHLNGNGSSARSEISGTASTNAESNRVYGAVVTGKITHTYNTITGNYIFEGWGTDNTPSTTNASYEYNITANTIVYAFFTKAHTVTYSRVPTAAADAPTTNSSVTSGSLVASGTSVAFTAKTAKTGYTWKGWYSNNTGTGNALSTNLAYTRSITANTTIYAVYTANTYTVKFDANGGSGTMSDQNFTYGTSQNLTANAFTRTGYTFAGWATSANENKVYNDKQSVSNLSSTNGATVTLYAKWTPINYTITYNTNGGNSIANKTYTIETATFDLPTPTKDGCTFVGWYDNEGFTGDAVTRIAEGSYGNKIFYAKWDAEKFTLIWDANGGTITTPGSPEGGEVEAGTTLTAPTVEKDHYDFDGWTPEEPTVMPGEDVTYTAQWTPKEYTITYNLNGGNGTMTPTTYTIESETFTLPKNPTKAGHTFAGWYANAELTGDAVTQIKKGSTGDKAYWAKWDVASYTITFDQQSGSDGTPSVTAQYGAKLSAITIPSRDGYLFDGYYTHTGGKGTKYYNADGTTTKNMPHNISKLYANWIGYDHCIFFKNTLGTLGWKDVYVYTFKADSWYEYEDGTTKYGPGVCPKVNAIEFGKMTQIGKTDIFYYVLTDLTGFNYIAFSNAAMNTYDEFYGNKAIYRGDRSDQLQLFIPNATGSTKVVNQTTYYNDGIWMKYNSKDSGYDWSGKTADSDWSDHALQAEKKGDYSFTATISLKAGTNYEFKISNVGKKADNDKIKETAWYGWSGTMTQANCTNKHFKHNTSNNAMITPTVDGDYTFTVYLGDGKVMVSLEYPLSKDDYRLAYDDITLSNIHEGHYLKKRTTGEILDTVSFFVRKDKTPQILLQQCTNIVDGKPTWATVNTYNITVNADGVYNFVLKQTNSGTHTATLETSATHKYTGDYYVRTDAAEGGWKSYRQASNRMNYSTYADSHSEFNHYFCSYREAGCNVKFIVANDYSECLTETMDNDDIIRPNQSSVGCLPENANVRFGWDSETNQLSRAYISGAGLVQDRFLVLMGNEYLKDAKGQALIAGTNGSPRYGLKANEEIFDDMGNWIYQVDVQACNQTTIKLSALYNGQEQLFKGARNDISLLNSTEPTYYKVRMIYDFKTNHMISAWLLDEQGNTIKGEGSLASDILVIRKNQDQANQLTFKGDAERTDVGVVYGVMTFEKDFVNDTEKSIYERALYWISFPFNVKLKDIFGFSNYGDHWILEEYNGQARAENGAWVDSESYWEYITNSEYELEAGKGYVLCLDLDKMGVNSDVFQHTDEVSLYFPSKEELGTINGDPTPITLDPYTCIIERDNRNIYDSNWHLIGVPRFADITTENINIIPQPTQENVGFYYEYGSNGEYTVKKSGATTFHTMSAYLVQYAGVINWTSTGIIVPTAIAARKNSPAEPEQVHLRLEIAQDDEMADQTFVQLQQEGATAEFDMNLDLTKMLHSGTNIYTLAGEQGIKSAGNVMPMSECVVPVGVKVDTDGEYTFRMPDGTEGMVVELIDYYTNTRTNLLLFDYTVTLPKGTNEGRFALHIQPSKSGVTTNIDQINGGSMHHEGVQKYIIDGKLIIRTAEGEVFDAQGHRL